MKKEELKKILKPLIKDCIKEVIFEEGSLSNIVSEVLKGVQGSSLVENQKLSNKQPAPQRLESNSEAQTRRKNKLQEHKKKLLSSIGRDSYNGVDIFEGTTPTRTAAASSKAPAGANALDGVSPNDPGVDISSFGLPAGVWKKLAGN